MALRRALLQASACNRLVALHHHVQPASPQPLAHHLQRFMSTEAAANAAVEDTLRPKVLRLFAFIMVCGAGLRILPLVAASAVGNTLALLEAQQPFMVKAGCSRLQLLMRLEAGMAKAVEEGAAPRLLRLIPPLQLQPEQQQQQQPDQQQQPERQQRQRHKHVRPLPPPPQQPQPQQPEADEGVVDYAMAALEQLAGSDDGLQALAAAGGAARLGAYLAAAPRTPQSEDAVFRARRLVAALSASSTS